LEFEWDEEKRAKVRQERGFDLFEAALIFEGPVLTRPDERTNYGEERLVSTGYVGEVCYVVVHTTRAGVTRLITAWKGGRRDRAQYQENLAGGNSPDEGSR
jgi:uncharacterized DUF497 family protein